jgi:hypothetical protein
MSYLRVPGILMLYHHPFIRRASTIMEHVNALRNHSAFKVWNLNTELGFPAGLDDCRFDTIVLHYSLFGPTSHLLKAQFLEYLERSTDSYKIAVLQDEYTGSPQRFEFLDRYCIDCVYTLVEPQYFDAVYGRHTKVKKLIWTIPGYVSDDLIAKAPRFTKPDAKRQIDIGYRARQPRPFLGRGGREKYDIAVGFRERAASAGLTVDIETAEDRRIYGDDWYRFLGDCRAALGVEAGSSIIDLDGSVRSAYEQLIADHPDTPFEEIAPHLEQWEGNVPYRTISPRHFEAAALRTCQILFEGTYSGILQPMVHYIPLEKDFSNFDEVLSMFRNDELRQQLTENAYRDLIASGDYSYRRFAEEFDDELMKEGLQPGITAENVTAVDRLLRRDRMQRQSRAWLAATQYRPFPGQRVILPIAWPLAVVAVRGYRRAKMAISRKAYS